MLPLLLCFVLQHKTKTKPRAVVKYLINFPPGQAKIQMVVCVGGAEPENISEHAGSGGS